MNAKRNTLFVALATLCAPAVALDKMPDEPGFSGFFNIGGSVGSIESNMLAELKGIGVDLGDETIDNFGSPDDEDITTVALNLSVSYTFSNLKTQVSLGNDLADFLQFDRSTILSVRHDFDSVGRMQLALLASPSLATEVWEDPYVLDAKRKGTERSNTGLRLTWDKIFGSQFEVKIQSREIELDNERSGEALGLDKASRDLLDREGTKSRVEVGYLFNFGEGTHLLRPSVTFIDNDLDGDAMAEDGYQATVSYAFRTDSLVWANNISYTALEGDEKNPIQDPAFNGKVRDSDTVTFATQMFFPGLFGLEHWQPNVSIVYGDSDNDIDFYDASGWMASVAIGRTF